MLISSEKMAHSFHGRLHNPVLLPALLARIVLAPLCTTDIDLGEMRGTLCHKLFRSPPFTRVSASAMYDPSLYSQKPQRTCPHHDSAAMFLVSCVFRGDRRQAVCRPTGKLSHFGRADETAEVYQPLFDLICVSRSAHNSRYRRALTV